jgi:hypothetical protein
MRAALPGQCAIAMHCGETDEHGQRYTVDFPMTGLLGEATVRSIWIIRSGENFPRLVSCYIL